MPTNINRTAVWILRIIAAVIMLQTLFFKFTGAEESVYIFSQLGMEPWGRFGTGALELIASLLILFPRTSFLGAGLGAGLMSGALASHFTKLGISVKGDGGQLFVYALITLLCCVLLLIHHRQDILLFTKNVFPKTNKA